MEPFREFGEFMRGERYYYRLGVPTEGPIVLGRWFRGVEGKTWESYVVLPQVPDP